MDTAALLFTMYRITGNRICWQTLWTMKPINIANPYFFLKGTSHGPGVQRREEFQNGSAVAETSLGVHGHNSGPNEKGKAPPSGHLVNRMFNYC